MIDQYPYLGTGVRVELRSGPFRGLQGIVQDRTQVGFNLLEALTPGSAPSVELDGATPVPVERHGAV